MREGVVNVVARPGKLHYLVFTSNKTDEYIAHSCGIIAVQFTPRIVYTKHIPQRRMNVLLTSYEKRSLPVHP